MELMHCNTRTVHPPEVPVDVYIYLPKEKRFFRVDDSDIDETETTFYFEIGIGKNSMLIEDQITFKNDDLVTYVDDLKVDEGKFYDN
jgi:hypothetical protein